MGFHPSLQVFNNQRVNAPNKLEQVSSNGCLSLGLEEKSLSGRVLSSVTFWDAPSQMEEIPHLASETESRVLTGMVFGEILGRWFRFIWGLNWLIKVITLVYSAVYCLKKLKIFLRQTSACYCGL